MKDNKYYQDRLLFTILKVVKENGNIQILLDDNIDYFELSKILISLKQNGLIRDYLGELEITELGIKEINRIQKLMHFGNVEKLVVPEYKYFIEKQSPNEVYLPCPPTSIML